MSFIDMYMRFFLGIPGQMAFELAKQYQDYIYAFGMFYGVFITVGAYNYRKILPAKTEAFMLSKLRDMKAQNANLTLEELEHTLLHEWKTMINRLPKYMCIMGKRDFWVVWPDGDKYAAKLNIDAVYVKKLVERAG